MSKKITILCLLQMFTQILKSIMIYFCLFRMGEIVIELYWKHAPQTCRNFAELARRGYYNGTKLHRIIPDFMIQGNSIKRYPLKG